MNVFAKCIWKESDPAEFHFTGYNKILVGVSLHPEGQIPCFEILKKEIGAQGKLIEIQDHDLFDAMRQAKLQLHVSLKPTENPQIHWLQIYATVNATTNVSEEEITSTIWKMEFLLQNEKEFNHDLQQALQNALDTFFANYFQTNPQVKGKAVIYLIRISG